MTLQLGVSFLVKTVMFVDGVVSSLHQIIVIEDVER